MVGQRSARAISAAPSYSPVAKKARCMKEDEEQLSLLRSRGEKPEEVISKRWRRALEARDNSQSRLVRGENEDDDNDEGNDDSKATEAAEILLSLVEEDRKARWHEPFLRPMRCFGVERKGKKQYYGPMGIGKPLMRHIRDGAIPRKKHRRCAPDPRPVPHHPSTRIYTYQGDETPMPNHLLSSSDVNPNIADKDASPGNLASRESITPLMRSYDKGKLLMPLEGLKWLNTNSNPTQM